jgi:cytoskeletal protein RodZ
MIGFVEDLWQSVFTPGATPTLILTTHATFALLVTTLTVFAFLTKSIHIINLLVLSILLWGTLTWFIAELKKTDALKSNGELQETSTEEPATTTTTTTSIQTKNKPTQRRSRKA